MPPPIDDSIFEILAEGSCRSQRDEQLQTTHINAEYVEDSQSSDQDWGEDSIVSVVDSHPQSSRKSQTRGRAKMTKKEMEALDRDLIASAPSLQRILEVLGMPVKQRHLAEPDCFYPLTGELRPPFKKFYHDDVLKAKEQLAAAKFAGGSNQRNINTAKAAPEQFLHNDNSKQKNPGDGNVKTEKQFRLKLNVSPKKPREQFSRQQQARSLTLEPSSASETTRRSKTPQGHSATILSAPNPSPITPTQPNARRHHDSGTGGKFRAPNLPRSLVKNVHSQRGQATTQEPPPRLTSNMIKCSITSCKLGNFDARQLKAHEIKPHDVQETLSNHGMWLCPQCSKTAQTMLSGQQAAIPPPRKIETKFGADWLDDAELRAHLMDLACLVEQYTNSACFDDLGPFQRLPILNVPCIQKETENSTNSLVSTLRKMLDIHEGVSLRAAIQDTHQELDNAWWINGVLIFLIGEFIFKNKDPFENPQILKQSINYLGDRLGLSPVEMIQDTRIRAMKASPRPPQFANRLKLRYDKFVEKLNATMHPLVGNSSAIYEKHKEIAKAAEEVNLRVFAYKHAYELICPKLGDRFSSKEHTLYELDSEKNEGKKILLTKMLGVKIAIGGGNWRVCQKAEVGLLPDSEGGTTNTSAIPQKRYHSQVS